MAEYNGGRDYQQVTQKLDMFSLVCIMCNSWDHVSIKLVHVMYNSQDHVSIRPNAQSQSSQSIYINYNYCQCDIFLKNDSIL